MAQLELPKWTGSGRGDDVRSFLLPPEARLAEIYPMQTVGIEANILT